MTLPEPNQPPRHARLRDPDPGDALLDSAVRSIAERYTKLVLVVGSGPVGENGVLERLAARNGGFVVHIGLELSRALLDIPQRRRPVAAADIAADLCRGDGSVGVRVLDGVEALFQPELKLNPLKILQEAARNRIVVAEWPGTFDGVVLRYGQAGHPEFREYHTPDALPVRAATPTRGFA